MALQWSTGKVTRNHNWAEGLFTLHVEVNGVAEFEPGQFLQVGLDIDGKRVFRPYSVASPWGPQLEFYIVEVDGGELTPHLARLRPGEDIQISQRATGRFTLKHAPDAEQLWLMATGTGLAPYIAMLRTTLPWQRFRKIVVVHGVRYASDLGYRDELCQLQGEHASQLCYIPCLTRETSPGTLAGRIPSLLVDGSLEAAAACSICPEESVVLLCGNPAMLDDVEAILGERGMRQHRSKKPGHIVLERYW